MPTSFGQVIGVTGTGNGFQGSVSRLGERVIAARAFQPYNVNNNLNFGDPAVQLPNVGSGGGVYTSVKDFVAAAVANIGLLTGYFAGMAVREVKTQLTYPAGQTPGIQQVGYYANLQMAEVLERGSATILLSVGTPLAGAQLYTRVVLNGAVPAGFVGDWETNPAATDQFVDTTGTGTINTSTLTITNANIKVGQLVIGPGMTDGVTYVTAYTPGTATLSTPLRIGVVAGTPLQFNNLVALPSVVARTGNLDSNNILEITLKNRVAA